MGSEGTMEAPHKWRHYHFIEFPISLSSCALGMTGTIVSDLLIYQSCREILGESHDDTCQLLHTNSSSQAAIDLEKLVQPHASYILLCKSLIEGIIPAFLSLFFGPWSDKHGRKPILIAALAGPCLMLTILSILSHWNMNPWLYLFACIPPSLLGGIPGLMLAIFCYISDITNNEDRAWRLAWFESCFAAGLVSGTLIGPLIFRKWGYTTLFAIAALLLNIAIIYVVLWIPESIKNQSVEKWGNPLNFIFLKELIQTAIRKRQGLHPFTLWCSILILSFYVITINGQMNMGYLFASARLGWNTVQYSYFNSIGITVTIFGTIFGIRIFTLMGFSDTSVALVGALSAFAAAMGGALTYKSWHMYLTIAVGAFSGIVSPPVRSILSKSVPPKDVGKVFSLTSSIETILPLGTGSLYTLIYSNYMPPVYPSPIHLLSASFLLLIITIVIFIDIARLVSGNSGYHTPVEED